MLQRMTTILFACLLAGTILAIPAAETASAQQIPGPYKDVRELPEGAHGERIQGLVDLFGQDDAGKVRAFIEANFTEAFRNLAPMEQHLQVFASIHERSRGFEFYGIRRYEAGARPGEYVVIVRNKLTRAWEAFVMRIETAPPHRIAGMQIAPARAPSGLPPEKKLTEEEFAGELEAFVERLTAADAFSGTVLLAKDGKVLFQGAYGLASRRFGVPNKIDTKFNLGSMNKMFTSVAVAQLVQRGELSLDDTLDKSLGVDWLPEEITSKVEIKHLLSHTSGLGGYFNEEFMKSSRLLFRELDDYKPLMAGETLAFEPGTRWQYSNTGMFLLGVVIEKVTGQSYFEFIRENIYEPAGMINSDCYDMDRPVANLAIGYSKDADGWTNNIYKHVVRGGPAGGGFSTVGDLLRFDRALRSLILLDAEHTEMVLSPKPELNSPGYGFGFSISGSPDDRVVGHGGGFAGINSNLDMFLDSSWTAAVMSNSDYGAEPVKSKMREMIAALQ